MAPQRVRSALNDVQNSPLPTHVPAQRVSRRKTQQFGLFMHSNQPVKDMPAPALPHHNRPRKPDPKRLVSSRPFILQAAIRAQTNALNIGRLSNPKRKRSTQQPHQHNDPERRADRHERERNIEQKRKRYFADVFAFFGLPVSAHGPIPQRV